MITTLLSTIEPDYRLIAASALVLFVAKRIEGWSIANCVTAIDPDTPLRVDDALLPVEAVPNDQVIEIAGALMRSGSVR